MTHEPRGARPPIATAAGCRVAARQLLVARILTATKVREVVQVAHSPATARTRRTTRLPRWIPQPSAVPGLC
jgi:hypothetical protein